MWKRGCLARGGPGGDFLSGLGPDDRLVPVATLVVHLGSERWDGPTSLRGVLADADPGILSLVQDYRVNLVDPAGIPDADFARFSTDVGAVLEFVKRAADKDARRRPHREEGPAPRRAWARQGPRSDVAMTAKTASWFTETERVVRRLLATDACFRSST